MPDLAVFTDQFTDTASVDLLDHTPNLGDGYSRHDDYATALVISNANRARNAGSGDVVALYLADWTPPSADYIVKGRIRKLSAVTNHYTGLMGRVSTDELTGYIIMQLPAGEWQLAKLLNGAYFQIGSDYLQDLVDGTDYDVELRMAGDQISVVIDDVVRITATDDGITDAGRAGIVSYVGVGNTTGLHLDSFEIAVDVPVEEIPVTDANLYFSANFYDDGTGAPQATNIRANATYAETVNPGAEARIAFNGTQCTPIFDVTGYDGFDSGKTPRVRYRLDSTDDGDWVIVQLTDNARAISLTELADEDHVLELIFESTDWTEERWTSPVSRLRITGFELDVGAEAIPLPTSHAPKATNAVVFGDSITEGLSITASTVAGSSAFLCYSKRLCDLLGCNRVNVGFGAQGYKWVGTGGVPAFSNLGTPASSTWRSHISGKTRLNGLLAVPQAEHVFIVQGTNDDLNGQDPTLNVAAELTAKREAYPLASLWQCIPFGGYSRAEVTAGFAAYQLATPDDNAFLYDGGATIQEGLDEFGTPTPESIDGLHPNAAKSVEIADDMFAFVAANAPQSITITYPAEGSILLVGTEATITWDDTGTITAVNIYLDDVLIAEDEPNTGSFAFTPEQSQVTAAAVIRVESAADDSVSAESDEFVIATTTTSGGSVGRNRVPIQPAY